MNQILETKNKIKNYRKIFKIQFIISFLTIIILYIYILKENSIKENEYEITKIVSQNARIVSLFENYNSEEYYKNDIYFCTLKIPKINLEYFVYKSYTENNLKILPCKFSGGNLNENGNICIIGHNYFDDRFFGNINELKIGDKIILEDLQGIEFYYYIYDIYEINENEIYEVIKNEENLKTITLCTCTTNKNSRLIVKAKLV